jgi:hypothetical protein
MCYLLQAINYSSLSNLLFSSLFYSSEVSKEPTVPQNLFVLHFVVYLPNLVYFAIGRVQFAYKSHCFLHGNSLLLKKNSHKG